MTLINCDMKVETCQLCLIFWGRQGSKAPHGDHFVCPTVMLCFCWPHMHSAEYNENIPRCFMLVYTCTYTSTRLYYFLCKNNISPYILQYIIFYLFLFNTEAFKEIRHHLLMYFTKIIFVLIYYWKIEVPEKLCTCIADVSSNLTLQFWHNFIIQLHLSILQIFILHRKMKQIAD